MEKHLDGEDIKKTSWQTDGERVDQASLTKVLFTNSAVESFLSNTNKRFIVASKGIGKTLLLRNKRYELEKQYGTDLFIPTDTPYLDSVPHFGSLTEEAKFRFSEWGFCKTFWILAIEIAAFSYYCKRTNKDFPVDALNKGNRSNFKWENVKGGLTPTYVFREILALKTYKNLMQFQDRYSSKMDKYFKEIQSSVYIFIDKVDQSVDTPALKDQSELWKAIQIGLLEASWEIMGINNHVRIYTSLRQEAYANYHSANKAAISGDLTLIEYSYEDLEKITNKLSNFYEGMPFSSFIGLTQVNNATAFTSESCFKYLHRHTLGRPRDIVSICSRLSANKKGTCFDEFEFKRHVNEAATQNIAENVFAEVEILLKTLKKEEDREKFLSLLPYNILTLEELKNICNTFNTHKGHPVSDTSACLNSDCRACKAGLEHPFCELYNVGFLGVARRSLAGGYEQKFIEPYEINQFSEHVLPESSYYFVHPSLYHYIDSIKSDFKTGRYWRFRSILIGPRCSWTNDYKKLLDIQKELFTKIGVEPINDDEIEGLLEEFKNCAVKEKIKEKILEAGKNIVRKLTEHAMYSKLVEILNKILHGS